LANTLDDLTYQLRNGKYVVRDMIDKVVFHKKGPKGGSPWAIVLYLAKNFDVSRDKWYPPFACLCKYKRCKAPDGSGTYWQKRFSINISTHQMRRVAEQLLDWVDTLEDDYDIDCS